MPSCRNPLSHITQESSLFFPHILHIRFGVAHRKFKGWISRPRNFLRPKHFLKPMNFRRHRATWRLRQMGERCEGRVGSPHVERSYSLNMVDSSCGRSCRSSFLCSLGLQVSKQVPTRHSEIGRTVSTLSRVSARFSSSRCSGSGQSPTGRGYRTRP